VTCGWGGPHEYERRDAAVRRDAVRAVTVGGPHREDQRRPRPTRDDAHCRGRADAHEVVYEENKLRLHRYTPEETEHETPIVVVYALINRPYMLDIQPGMSVIQTLLGEGFGVYLVDWGEPSRLDRTLTFEDYVCRYLDNAIGEVCERSEVEDVHLLGYCMGGTLSVIYSALDPERVRTLGAMALAFNFDGDSGIYETWAEPLDIDQIAQTLGTLPADPLATVFAMRDPIVTLLTRFVDLYDRLEDDGFVETYARMEQWSGDGVDITGGAYSDFVGDIVQDNKLARGGLTVGDRQIDVSDIDVPVMQVIGEEDGIAPPNCARPLGEAVGSDDYTEFDWPTGHFGVSISPSAHQKLWPNVADWYAERGRADPPASAADDEGSEDRPDEDSGTDDAPDVARADSAPDEDGTVDAETNGHDESLEAIDGIGPTYAKRLATAGIDGPADLAKYDPDELAEIAETSASRTEQWLTQAN
jgi:polyhydroxyalkanoate synthase